MAKDSHKKPIISLTPASVGTPQPEMDVKKFDDAIWDKGYVANIERALRCPCASEVAGQAQSECQNCSGSGWFFIEKTETKLLCTSMSNKSKYEAWTEANMGMMSVTCRAADKLGFMDKITLRELESWFTQVLLLKESTTDATKYFSFLIYNPIFVFNIYLFIDSQTPLKSLVENTDYTIVDNKLMINKTVLQGYSVTQFPKISVRYTHNPTYHVIDINRDLIKQKSASTCDSSIPVNYPLNCIAKRAHYIINAPNADGDSVFDNTDYNKVQNYGR